MALEDYSDFITFVISREEVTSADFSVLPSLQKLTATPDTARSFMERVDIGFSGYDHHREDLFEITEVREYVQELDLKFPFWLFFLSKYHLGLQCISYCFLPPYLKEEAKAEIHPKKLANLLTKRWLPAMNHVCEFAGVGETEIMALTNRAIKYVTEGREQMPNE